MRGSRTNVNELKKPGEKLMVRRVAGERGQGAGSLYCYGYAEIAEVLQTKPVTVAMAVIAEALEPLSLIELALARKQGLNWLRAGCGGDPEFAGRVRALRPEVVSEVVVAHRPPLKITVGLDTLWAVTYVDVGQQACGSDSAARSASKGASKSLTIRSLSSILDFVESRHPLLVGS
jgi:hypothetical protein